MIKCEVLGKTSLVVEKGSVVLVDERQFELARKVLKPIADKKAEKVEEPKAEEEKPKRTKKQ